MANLSWQLVTFAVAVIAAIAGILAVPNVRARRWLLLAWAAVIVIGPFLLFWSYQSNSESASIKSEHLSQSKVTGALVPALTPETSGVLAPRPEVASGTFYDNGPPTCAGDNQARREIIAKISNSQSRDFEYGSFILSLLGCKSFVDAVDVASKIVGSVERDGVLTFIAIHAMKSNAYQEARTAVAKLSSTQARDLLTSILINEMSRPAGYDPYTTTYATDLIKLNYGSLGGATYDFRTGKFVDVFQPCVRGRASCGQVKPGEDTYSDYP